jgi:hypothetical protein
MLWLTCVDDRMFFTECPACPVLASTHSLGVLYTPIIIILPA